MVKIGRNNSEGYIDENYIITVRQKIIISNSRKRVQHFLVILSILNY